jgi:hypothetical protein
METCNPVPKPRRKRGREPMDMSMLPLAKEKPIIDQRAIDLVNTLPGCERCGSKWLCACHHIDKRAQGRKDVVEGMVKLCIKCHRDADEGKIPKEELRALATRQGRFNWVRR